MLFHIEQEIAVKYKTVFMTSSKVLIQTQWRIQDFPKRGIDSRGGYILKILYVETKESGHLGGRAPARPPRSANETPT